MTASATGSWVRVSRTTLPKIIAIVAVLSVLMGFAIAAPMSQLGTLVLLTPVHFVVGWLGGFVVVFLLLGVVFLPRASRSLEVDAEGAALRLGRRVIPASEVRHAYRIPDPVRDGRFQLRLAVPGGLDAIAGVSTVPPVELTESALAALIRLVERAPIEPESEFAVRPPLVEDVAPVSDPQGFADRVATTLLPFETFTYTKAVLLAELGRARRASVGAPVADGVVRDLGLVAPGTTNAPKLLATVEQAETAARAAPGKRGFFRLQGATYKAALRETEGWLHSMSSPVAASHGASWGWGLALVVVALAAPWIAMASIVNPYSLVAVGFAPLMGLAAFALLTWPFFAWGGLVLMWRARVARFERARSAALLVRQRGGAVPDSVAGFFGPPFPEQAYRTGVYLMLVMYSVLALAGGLTVVTLGLGGIENWDASAAAVGFGVLMAASSAPLFYLALQIGTRAAGRAVRSDVLWRAIASKAG